MQDISEDIIKKAADGDFKSFEVIYKTTADFVYNVARRIVNNREDAEEVAQETFLTVYHKLRDFRFESSFKTWVYRVTANHAINFARRMARVRRGMTVYEDGLTSGTATSGIEENVNQEHNEKVVEKLLEYLNPEQRACIVLRNIEELSYQDIAETLKININTVRSRLKRAREKLLAVQRQVDYERM